MTVIYADVLFLINVLVDYLLILMTGRLAGIPLQRKRFLLSAILGGVYGVAAAIPDMGVLLSPPVKVLIWVLIALSAYGRSQQFLKLTLLLGIISCTLAGVVLALGMLLCTAVDAHLFMSKVFLLLFFAVCACILCVPIFRSGICPRVFGTTLPVELSIAGKTLKLTALLDTGNQMRSPLTGESVLIVSACAIQSVFSAPLRELLSSDALQTPTDLPVKIRADAPDLCPGLILYQTLGVSSGTLLTLRTDWIKIQGITYPHATIALAPVALGFGYSALWGGTMKGESKHA